MAQEAPVKQAPFQFTDGVFQAFVQHTQRFAEKRACALQVEVHFSQRTPRQADGHGTLQAKECRTNSRQELLGVLVQQPVTTDGDLLKIQRRGVARLQAHQLQIIRTGEPNSMIRNRQYER
ncbi:hypothetical protein D3C79_745780 [compost metagenome]